MATRMRREQWTRRLQQTAAVAALTGLCLGQAPPASAAELRFVTTTPGGIVATGNTLGLSKQLNANGPGVEDSIGTFLSLDGATDESPPNPANPWPLGTTADWTQNGSAAELVLPDEHEVLYAELIWGGGYNYGENVTASLDTPVTLSAAGASATVTPAPLTAITLAEIAASGFAVNYYMRSADVTGFVQAHGPGTYEVRGVPATQTDTINSLNAAGWTLVVAYRDVSQPVRNLSIFVGGSFVDEDTTQDYVVSGFCAPPSGQVGGKVVISTLEGDANRTGDQLLIAPAVADPFINLLGPNNPANNFFCSQLNDSTGNLDTTGTFGNANHDAIAGVDIVGGRQGWDITSVPVSSADGQLIPGQTSAVMRTITTDDSFMPTLAAFQIDVNAPNFAAGISSIETNADVVGPGDVLTVTATIDNQGQAAATGLRLAMPLDSGLALKSFSSDGVPGDAQGNPVAASDLSSGVDEGDLPPGQHRTVVIDLDVIGPPSGSLFTIHPIWSYSFVTCQGDPPLTESYGGFVLVDYQESPTTGAGGASGTSSSTGSGGAGGGGASGGSGGDDGSTGEDGGCGCETPGHGGRDGASSLGVGALLLSMLAASRRRRYVART